MYTGTARLPFCIFCDNCFQDGYLKLRFTSHTGNIEEEFVYFHNLKDKIAVAKSADRNFTVAINNTKGLEGIKFEAGSRVQIDKYFGEEPFILYQKKYNVDVILDKIDRSVLLTAPSKKMSATPSKLRTPSSTTLRNHSNFLWNKLVSTEMLFVFFYYVLFRFYFIIFGHC